MFDRLWTSAIPTHSTDPGQVPAAAASEVMAETSTSLPSFIVNPEDKPKSARAPARRKSPLATSD